VIEIATSAPLVPTTDRLTNPDRLVFDFPGCELQGGNRHIPVNSGPVRELRLSLFSIHPPVTRVVVDSRVPVDFEMKPAGNRVVIEIAFPKAASVPAASAPQSSSVNSPVATEHTAPSAGIRKQHTPAITVPTAQSRASAYSLQAKAKALNIPDLQALEDKAGTGDPEAETTLGLAYHAGVLLKGNDAEALRLLHKAADRGFMAAQESLGIFSETGIGMEQPSPGEALEWYKKAVRQGSLDAATNIGLMYAEGRGIPKNPAEAVTWLRQAAEGGDAIAQYNLALIYGRGDGLSKDDKETVRWLTAAADQNVVPAMLDLANIYMRPPASTTADVDRAISYYEKAAELGNARAQAILGNIFAKGLQGKPDYEQSVNWYRKAAEQGDRDGELGLAIRYALGQAVPVDPEEARRLFLAAADLGQPDAQYNLAIMGEEGKGGPADRDLATHYYQLAAEQGMSKAQFRLGRLLANNRESRSNRVSAYKWLMLAQDSIKESAVALSDLRKSMNEQEIAEAEREVDAWRIAHQTTHQ
jgi:TPR repeat protein